MYVEIQKRRRQGKNAWSYRVILVLGERDEGGPNKITVGTCHHLRGEGGALDLRDQTLEEYRSGIYGGRFQGTVRQLIELWFHDGPERRQTTLAGYRKAAKDHIYGVEIESGIILGELTAARTTPAQWAAWQAGQLANGRVGGGPCSPKSVRDYRAVAHGAFAWACGVDLLRSNPLAKVKTPSLPKRRHEVPDLATMGAYVEEVRGTRYWMPLVLGSAALRRGEVLGLRWSDVDLATGKTQISRQLVQIGNEVHIQLPKTDAGYREITLPAFILEALAEHRRAVATNLLAAGDPWNEEAPICGEIKPDRLTHGLRQLFTKRGLPPVNMHRLRHAVATDMLRRGTNPRTVQEYLGHAHVATTLGTYTHVDGDDVAAASQAYARAWEEAQMTRSAKERHQSATNSPKVVQMSTRRSGKMPVNNDLEADRPE